MWCNFECDTCPARDYVCMPPKKDCDLEEANYKNISTSEEYYEMYRSLIEEEWDK